MVRPFEATRGARQFPAVGAVGTPAATLTAGGKRAGPRAGVARRAAFFAAGGGRRGGRGGASAAGEPGCPVGMIRVPHPVFAGRPLSGDRSILQTLRGVTPTPVSPRPVNGPLWSRPVNAPA